MKGYADYLINSDLETDAELELNSLDESFSGIDDDINAMSFADTWANQQVPGTTGLNLNLPEFDDEEPYEFDDDLYSEDGESDWGQSSFDDLHGVVSQKERRMLALAGLNESDCTLDDEDYDDYLNKEFYDDDDFSDDTYLFEDEDDLDFDDDDDETSLNEHRGDSQNSCDAALFQHRGKPGMKTKSKKGNATWLSNEYKKSSEYHKRKAKTAKSGVSKAYHKVISRYRKSDEAGYRDYGKKNYLPMYRGIRATKTLVTGKL